MTVQAASLAPFTTTGLQISANAVTRADAQLQLPTVAEAVTVAASAVRLQTDRAEVRSEIDTTQVNHLPVSGVRNYTALLALVPGVSPPAPAHSLAANPQESLAASVGGQTDERNDTRIDGAGNTFIWLPRLVAYSPPLETIEAVSVVTNSMDAETGMAGGAAINVLTKSGTNSFNGTVFEHHINSALKARNVFYFDPDKPKFMQNQWGGTLGGPIVRNKLFFFGSHEQTNRQSDVSRFFTVPTVEARRGDFSSYGTTIYDPLTGSPDGSGRTAFDNNIIPEAQDEQGRSSDHRVAAPSHGIGDQFELLCLGRGRVRPPLDGCEGQLEPLRTVHPVRARQHPEVLRMDAGSLWPCLRRSHTAGLDRRAGGWAEQEHLRRLHLHDRSDGVTGWHRRLQPCHA